MSKNLLAQGGEDQLDAEQGGAVVFVEDGIDLHHFHRNHGFGVGNHFHGEVSFAVGGTAAHGRANAGSVGGIHEIHVQTDGDASGVVHSIFEGFRHDIAHAALVNVAHGENVYPGFLDDFAFLGIEVARADNDDVSWLGFGSETAKVNELCGAVTHDGRERHAVDVSGGR